MDSGGLYTAIHSRPETAAMQMILKTEPQYMYIARVGFYKLKPQMPGWFSLAREKQKTVSNSFGLNNIILQWFFLQIINKFNFKMS